MPSGALTLTECAFTLTDWPRWVHCLTSPTLANWTASYASFGSSWQTVQHGSRTGSPRTTDHSSHGVREDPTPGEARNSTSEAGDGSMRGGRAHHRRGGLGIRSKRASWGAAR